MTLEGPKVEIRGQRSLVSRLARVPGGELGKFLQQAASSAKQLAAQGAPRTVRTTLATEVQSTSARVFSTLPPAQANTIEVGRSAGGPVPPLEPIEKWAQSRGIGGKAWVIARAIARRGTKGRFFMRNARNRLDQQLPRLLARFGKGIETRFGKS